MKSHPLHISVISSEI